ncbi:LacI family DNA-binding transcriptional regulator [Parafrigoribacterium soli]|uniref:LacI family DNA-binding transcriptional regulator n=1 Tax=Parafrigoribacterium soli TaxID=3144663 RepID=UPI0032EBA5AD
MFEVTQPEEAKLAVTSAPTLEMVAARAGVSRSTVSRVVNSSPQVTADVVAIVNAAIAELGYVPNRAARSLASRRTYAIALVIPENTAKFFSDPYFAAVIQGAANFLGASDYVLNLLIGSPGDELKTLRYVERGNVDGALVLSHHSDDGSYLKLGSSMPVVFGGRPAGSDSDEAYYVDIDNVEAGTMATRHLIERGRSRIATIAGPQDMSAGTDRIAGWRSALTGAKLTPGPIEYGDFTPVGGADAMRRLLQQHASFDGLFVASAQMASGALGVLREAGLSVPADVGVTTVDNDYFAINAIPPLTTIEQPTQQQGAKMAEMLLDIIEGRPVDRHATIATTLVIRDSA